uniref:Uncharacterized protein n=1 Tax=Sphaeramia orbicularis TaxID=375764 RepID=A0A672YLX5_9TELE
MPFSPPSLSNVPDLGGFPPSTAVTVNFIVACFSRSKHTLKIMKKRISSSLIQTMKLFSLKET